MDPEQLSILMCPITRGSLRVATDAELAAVNQRIRSGELSADPLDAGLVSGDGSWVYPVRDGIPVLLKAEAIALSAAERKPEASESSS